MKKLSFYFLMIFFTVANHVNAQENDSEEVLNLLRWQQDEWNKGNIISFMDGYWKSDSVAFMGKSGVTYGWEPTLKNYQKAFPDTTSMGKLTFTFIETKALSPEYHFVIGKFHLSRSIGDLEGYFSLLFRKIDGKWKIIVDHTS